MNRYLLLILLSSWAHVVPLSLQCETGVAYPKHELGIRQSLMANADVAVLKTYKTETVDKCITDCCTAKFGSCSVASFTKTNDTEGNCRHFYCLPVQKCKFLSSNSTDSFSFSSSAPALVPSSHASKNDSLPTVSIVTTPEPKLDKALQDNHEHTPSKETVASYTEEHFALKNDNTTIKPRKGVDDVTENIFENVSRSGVKPRKGVVLDGLTNSNNSQSKVKPRKGVGPFQSESVTPPTITVESSMHKLVSTENIIPNPSSSSSNINKNTIADDIVSALENVFEDDSDVHNINSSATSPVSSSTTEESLQTSTIVKNSFIPTSSISTYTSTTTEKLSSALHSSLTTSYVLSSSLRTPDLVTPTVQTTEMFGQYFQSSSSRPSIIEHSKLLFHESDSAHVKSEGNQETEESKNQRKYKSSMHLVLSLVFGLLVLFSVLGVIAKRIYDGWSRRHYRRMDFLIDGMYNGYG